MNRRWGVSDPTGQLLRVLVRPPSEAFGSADPETWHYTHRPDLAVAREEHHGLIEALAACGAEVEVHDEPLPGLADAQFVFDPVFMTSRGAILLRPGKELRRGEEEALACCLERLGVPVLGELKGDARAEGGDLLRLDGKTVAAGIGFRTNLEGLGQLRKILDGERTEILTFDLPCASGREACLHLRSLVSLLAPDLALAYRPLLPVRFFEELSRRFEIVEVPDSEFASMGPNVLALGPRRCLMLEGNPVTRARLESAGCDIATYRGTEISLAAEGGPTCLTLPLWRRGGGVA